MSEPAAALDGTTLHGLLSDDENRLLDAIDNLRSQGVGKLLKEKGLPQIIVCGDQSSGKSSVLEALTRVRFPTKSSICTTFPTELRLRREPRSQISCRIKPGSSRTPEEKQRLARFQESFDSPDKFPDLITAARKCMSETTKATNFAPTNSTSSPDGFFDDVLEVEIVGPKLAPLTIVDLPGLIHYRNSSSGDRDIKLVSSLVEGYMRQNNSIILAVVSAHNDINNQIVLSRIKAIVPSGHRTLGIITKPDELPSGSEKEQEYLDYARSNPMKFQYGWHVVRNRNYQEQSSTFEERDNKEQDFFSRSSWNSLPRREVGLGISSLRQKLSRMLLDHINLSLPSIVDHLVEDLGQSESELRKLGEARSSSKEQQNFLSDISDSFGEYTKDALDGRYRRHSFFGDPLSPEGLEKRLRANIRRLNDEFVTKMYEQGHKWQVLEDHEVTPEVLKAAIPGQPKIIAKSVFLRDHVDALAYQERGNELPGISNPALIGSLFQQQSEPWEAIALNHLDKTWKAVKQFLETLLDHLTGEKTCNQLLIHVIDPEMEARHQHLKMKLEELLTPHRNNDPLNVDPQFARRIWSTRERRIAESVIETMRQGYTSDDDAPWPSVDHIMDKISPGNPMVGNKFGSLETLEFTQAYYEATILVFINNVASLAIEQCLLAGLAKIFSSATIRNMDDEKLSFIAAESRETLNERKRLSERVDILRKGLQTIRMIQPNTRTRHKTASPNRTTKSPLPAPSPVGTPNFEQQAARLTASISQLSPEPQANTNLFSFSSEKSTAVSPSPFAKNSAAVSPSPFAQIHSASPMFGSGKTTATPNPPPKPKTQTYREQYHFG